jgi:prepilin signal peptidase PulO-like enzyme (type II secretory pathway)
MLNNLFQGEAKPTKAALTTPGLWGLWLAAMAWMVWVGAPFISAPLALFLLLLALVDLRTFTLPRMLTWPMIALGIAAWWLYGGMDGASFSLLGGLLGSGAFWLLRQFSLYALKKDGLGKGDITLFGAIGTWVGPFGLPLVALVASVLALVYLLAKRPGWGKRIPFGPYLCAAAWVVWLHQGDIWRWFGMAQS